MYSLVSAPILGFDLTRLQGGTAVADVLLCGLSFTESDVEILAGSALSDWDRLPLWHDVDEAARKRPTVRDLSAKGADLTGALSLLEQAPIGTVDGLLHCVRHDVLDWTWRDTPEGARQSDPAVRATAMLCDTVVAAYLRDLLPDDTRRRLAAGWVSAARRLPHRPVHLGPQHDVITRVLDRIRGMRPVELERLTRATEAARKTAADWAPAVHAASMAVFVSERVRAAAAAQFMLVRAIDDAAVPLADRAGGGWNLLSGTIQALVVRDLLGADTVARLVEPYLTTLGLMGLAE